MRYVDSYRAHLDARIRRARVARILLRRAVRFARARWRARRRPRRGLAALRPAIR